MKRILSALIAVSALSLAGFQYYNDLCEGIVPDNDLYIPVNNFENSGLTKAEFDATLDRIETHYAPLFEKKGGRFIVQRAWDDGTVNAQATRFGSSYYIKMFGGLARHETITQDAFLLVACHEVGHHLGGAPRVSLLFWSAANEGQSDYFGTMNCFKRVLETDNNVDIVSEMELDPFAEAACLETYPTDDNLAAICVRAAMAGRSLGELFRVLKNLETPPKFETPDSKKSLKTDNAHPDPQCRLDTYFQGALCIMGKDADLNERDPFAGTCNRRDGYATGVRPFCWFSPSDFRLL